MGVELKSNQKKFRLEASGSLASLSQTVTVHAPNTNAWFQVPEEVSFGYACSPLLLMKTRSLVFLLLLTIGLGVQAQLAQNEPISLDANRKGGVSDFSVVERGANHRVLERSSYTTLPSGKVVSQVHHYTELATGMHYQENGEWKESKE